MLGSNVPKKDLYKTNKQITLEEAHAECEKAFIAHYINEKGGGNLGRIRLQKLFFLSYCVWITLVPALIEEDIITSELNYEPLFDANFVAGAYGPFDRFILDLQKDGVFKEPLVSEAYEQWKVERKNNKLLVLDKLMKDSERFNDFSLVDITQTKLWRNYYDEERNKELLSIPSHEIYEYYFGRTTV